MGGGLGGGAAGLPAGFVAALPAGRAAVLSNVNPLIGFFNAIEIISLLS
jgi:hypothetical protein